MRIVKLALGLALVTLSFFLSSQESELMKGKVGYGPPYIKIFNTPNFKDQVKNASDEILYLKEHSEIILVSNELYSRFALKVSLTGNSKLYKSKYSDRMYGNMVKVASSEAPKEMYVHETNTSYIKRDGKYYSAAQYLNMQTLKFEELKRQETIAELKNAKREWSRDRLVTVYQLAQKVDNAIEEIKVAQKNRALKTLKLAYETALNSDSYAEYKNYIDSSEGKNHKYDNDIATKAYLFVKNKSQLHDLTTFITDFSYSKERDLAVNQVFKIISLENKIEKFSWFIDNYPNSLEATQAISSISKIVKQKNNTSGFAWFLKNYSYAPEAKEILLKLHKSSFALAKSINTIDSYNDFIMAYPLAKQVKEATKIAYELDKKEYTGLLNFFSEEKEARRLLIQSKLLEQSSNKLSKDERIGYLLVVNRMISLLQREFDSSEAVLRHLESNEFKSFVGKFDDAMNHINSQLSYIASNTSNITRNTSDLSDILKNQSSLMNNHFENAAQDRQMASELTKQHRFWERYVGEVGY